MNNVSALRLVLFPLAVLGLLLISGTLGYRLVGGWEWFDALYMTVITITTVGFHEVRPLGPTGRLFTMALALGGVFTAFYAAAAFIRAVVAGDIRTVFGRQRMESQLAHLNDHLVVCGFGRMGRLVCEEFSAAALPFVVIDRDPHVLQDFSVEHGIPLSGDATDDDVLKQAGVERARALVSAAASDADNLYIVMIKSELGIIIVAIKKPDGRMVFNPVPEAMLGAGDVLIALGHRQQLDRLEAMARAPRLSRPPPG